MIHKNIFVDWQKVLLRKHLREIENIDTYVIGTHDYMKKIDNVIHYISEYFKRSKYQEN